MHLYGLRRKLCLFHGYGADTAAVGGFLGFELGRALPAGDLDVLLLVATTAMVIVQPYRLPSRTDRPSFARWAFLRVFIVAIAVFLGFQFIHVPRSESSETLRFVPLTLLILASMISCSIRFYSLMRLRLAK